VNLGPAGKLLGIVDSLKGEYDCFIEPVVASG
jgi:hypothetical protein